VAGRAGQPLSRFSSTSSSATAEGRWGLIPDGYNALVHCDRERRRRYHEPSLRGERNGSYAITEPGAGSDARTLGRAAAACATSRRSCPTDLRSNPMTIGGSSSRPPASAHLSGNSRPPLTDPEGSHGRSVPDRTAKDPGLHVARTGR
jgi:hypothetical protein